MLMQQDLSTFQIRAVVDRAAALFGTRFAAMTLLDNNRQWIAVSKGLKLSVTSRAIAFCGHTILSDQPLVVPEAAADDRFAGNPLVAGAANIQSYVGAPLTVRGVAVGALCVLDDGPMAGVDASLVDQLRGLAAIVAESLEAELSRSSIDVREDGNTRKIGRSQGRGS